MLSQFEFSLLRLRKERNKQKERERERENREKRTVKAVVRGENFLLSRRSHFKCVFLCVCMYLNVVLKVGHFFIHIKNK